MSNQPVDLVSLLASFPAYNGVVFAADDGRSVALGEGEKVTVVEPLPVTPDARRAAGNFSDARRAAGNFSGLGLWAVRTTSARDLGHYMPWREMALLPGTELTVLKRTRYDRTPVTALVDDDDRPPEQVLTEVARAIRRDRAHGELHDADPDRYVTDLRTPGVGWDLHRLADPATRKPDLDALSREELVAHFDERERLARQRFRSVGGEPFDISFAPGAPASLRFIEDEHWREVSIGGLRRSGSGLVLLVDLGEEGVWGAVRADGRSWAESSDARSGTVPEPDVKVRVGDSSGAPHRRALLRPTGGGRD